jgi:putative membrane protein
MQWWCAARGSAWTWSWQAYPGVWLFILAIGLAYWRLYGRGRPLRARHAGAHEEEVPTGGGVPPRGWPGWFLAGLLCLWLALDWPLGALGAGYLASVHMLQFVLITLIAPPLILLGVPAGRPELRAGSRSLLRLVTHPLIALVTFNLIIIFTHLPSVVDGLMATQLGSFLIDLVWLVGGVIFWWPIILDSPARPGFGHPMKIGYLILATIVNTGTFLYLTFSELPVYSIYELAPPVYGIPARDDQRVAGLLMKVGTAAVLWTAIGILFYLWYREENDEPTSTSHA